MTDEVLMANYREGNEEAFNQLYLKYSPMVYGYIKRRLRPSEVDDFYQKVWRHLHEKRGFFQNQPFAPWFFVMIRHLLIDEYRRLSRRSEKDFETDLIDIIYVSTQRTDVSEELSHLAPDIRELVEKYYLDGASYEELAQETGMSQTNLRQRLSRAMRNLRKKIEALYEE